MSTTAYIHFASAGCHVVSVYRYTDGYPDGPCGVFADWSRFLDELRLDDSFEAYEALHRKPGILASRYVAWLCTQRQTCEIGTGPGRPADRAYWATIDPETGPRIEGDDP